ncbi:class I SAM-dependent methyltransferase [soil metagenome]
MTDERTILRSTFNRDALLYDEARPGYPEELFDDIVALSDIPDGGRILELGCGTGIATVPFARRGYRIRCVELGEQLAAVARKNLAPYPDAEVYVGAFEDWPVEEAAFDLAFAATAFHWIEPALGYRKFAQALKPDGSLALFRHEHVHSDTSAGFFEDVQEFYEEAGLAKESDFRMPLPHEIGDDTAQIEGSGLFGPVDVRRYIWDIEYDAARYIQVLSTYSGHINLDDARRKRLFSDITSSIDAQPNGRITKGYMSILHVAKRNDQPIS